MYLLKYSIKNKYLSECLLLKKSITKYSHTSFNVTFDNNTRYNEVFKIKSYHSTMVM